MKRVLKASDCRWFRWAEAAVSCGVCNMVTADKIRSTKGGREQTVLEEQALCRQAVESGAFDSMSDEDWVALCEQVAQEAREDAE